MADIFSDDFKLEKEVNVEEERKDDGEEKEKKKNPFSFSNFLNSKPSNSNEETVEKNDEPVVKEKKQLVETETPEISEANPFSFKNFASSETKEKQAKKLQIIVDDDDDGDNVKIESSCSKVVETVKFDDIADGSFSSECEEEDASESPKEADTTTDSEEDSQLLKIEQLIRENTALRNDLSQVREEFLEYRRTANKRVTSLQKELEKVRRKEAEETQDLENAVRLVEENLTKTTERATKAEATVSRLREEVNILKTENVSKSSYDNLMLEYNQLLNTIQEKSRGVSQLMRTAADKTEPHVKQLQSGISSLRFFAQQFEDICKISEIPTKRNNPDDDVT